MKIGKKAEDRIRSALPKFQKVLGLAKDRDLNESDTVAIINDMLAEVFGYEKYSEITSELMIRGTFCDLAIRLNDKFENGFLIECKRVGCELKEDHMRQAVNYGVNKGIQWVVLTNGIDWRLYRLKFEQPVTWDLVLRLDLQNIDIKNEIEFEKLATLTKEGVLKNAREELYEKVQCVNRFVIGQLILNEPVMSVIRKELKKLSEGINVEESEIEKILTTGVLRRDIIDEENTDCQNAVARVAKFYKQSARKAVKKEVQKVEPISRLADEAISNANITEKLLAEAEAAEKKDVPEMSPEDAENTAIHDMNMKSGFDKE